MDYHGMTIKTAQFLNDMTDELKSARRKFPSSDAAMVALVEEVGELAKAMLEESTDRVWAEAVQVAAMACRVASEGDSTLDCVREARGVEATVPTAAGAEDSSGAV